MSRLAAAVLLSTLACATTREGVQSTEVLVVDETGAGLYGEISLWSRRANDKCEIDETACSISLPAGFYSMNFRKMKPARMISGMGGSSIGSGDRYGGCLRARVQLVPGRAITCKKQAEFNCARGANDTMDCGPSTAARYGYKPKKDDDDTEPPAAPAPK